MKTRTLITGGAGFIGSHLCERLLKEGHEVICADNLFTGNKQNIRPLLNHEYFEFIRHDISLPLHVECDEIYNLACPASPKYYKEDPIKTVKTLVFGAINMLDLAKKTNSKILQASTSEVYGDPQIQPQTESYWGHVNPVGIRSCYDEGKRLAETLCMDYYRKYHLPVKIMRIFNTYGPRMDMNDGRVVPNFIVQALRNEDLTVYGDGKQTRSFCFIDDLLEAMIALMKTEDTFTGPINLGNVEEYTMLDLAQKITELTDSKSKTVFCKLPQDDPSQRKPDITLAKEKLNWKASTCLDEGLKKTIEYFKGII